jgi:hypothetical protein
MTATADSQSTIFFFGYWIWFKTYFACIFVNSNYFWAVRVILKVGVNKIDDKVSKMSNFAVMNRRCRVTF